MVNYRPMGKTELEVSEIGFGVWTLASGQWGSFTDDQAVDLLRKAYDAGINYFDVSPTDGNGRGERLLGRAFGDKRELVIISSKAGRSETGAEFSPAAIRKSLEGTLGRLGSSYVDALQLHYPDAATVANPAVWQTFEDLKMEGKIRYYGIALGPGPGGLEEGRAAMRKHDLGCIQTYYNLLEEEPGRKFFPVALEIEQGMVIRAPHAGGVLESDPEAVKFPADGDLRTKDGAWLERARKQAANLKWIYEGKGMKLSQAALKFILSEETVASVLPNIYREEHLPEYAAVSDFESFSQVELGEIAEQFRKGFGV
ncbi:MAG: aldo/keto reductase [Methanobacteriota archaeon]|nr:MAG: aldo/keto reductase [Euryarchaeota archaeon]